MSYLKEYNFKTLKSILQQSTPEDAACPYCNTILERKDIHHPAYISIDHINPFSRCKEHKLSNLIATCGQCNWSKSDSLVFTTYQLATPQRLSAEQIKALKYIQKFDGIVLLLEEIRVLILNRDLPSLNYYVKDCSSVRFEQEAIKDLKRILFLISKSGNKNVIAQMAEFYKIEANKISTKVLVETIIDNEIDFHTKRIAEAQELTKTLKYIFKTINTADIKKEKQIS